MNERTAERQPLFRPQDRRRVLVVEDSKTFAIALRQMIEAETGLKVTSCACLKDLSSAILKDQEGYAIAVVDLNLPDAPDGEALDWTVSHGIPTIVFTGTFNAATRARIMEREVFDYVLKDSEFALGNLVGSVKRALTNRETRILVVDDMTTTRRLLAQMLTSQQYTVVEVGSGADALTMLEKDQDIRLVVSDYNMPDMDGFELARRIRRRYSAEQVRVIGISSSTDRAISAGFLKAGAHDFISRPFVLEELQCRIASNAETLLRMRQLHDLAWRDYLTGLFNRRYFFERGPKMIAEARRSEQPTCVAILDIDHFKRLNDEHGHDAGDEALRVFSAELGEALAGRPHLLARLGGEEFALLLPGLDQSNAGSLADAIRAGIAERPMAVGPLMLGLTVSIGLAEISARDSLDVALRNADRALYAAKQAGRNRIQA
ncbi:diguanylate cyclase [Bosea sp. (in: a-proteobacteria)]|uniref:GGDEF domain-containing response regulator n=1 Tax=Bosea sp. (in: a-proteobacteria) TaxID=1871050 RepID=UPI0027332F03|nr:diguanylate cyclase [Bosea sp. (in: a-proteobacteria)]MDP3258759.1 diguanylate cyclase [Bosea sp. (in: a-proteobacteria)]